MATLVSPGVEVTVTDESAYASPGSGTIPLIVIATRSNKEDPTGTYPDGIAQYTKSVFAGAVVPVTSQREITQFFGEPIFSEGEGQETSEYGLLAGYSYLGQGSQAYIVRADVDLAQLEPTQTEPTGPVPGGSYWVDTDDTSYGVHEWNGTTWVAKSVEVEVDLDAASTDVAGAYTPLVSGSEEEGDVKVCILRDTITDEVAFLYFQYDTGAWTKIDTAFTTTNVYLPHYSPPTSPTTGDLWIKTTSPGNGLSLELFRANADGVFGAFSVDGVSDIPGSTDYIPQDGSGLSVITDFDTDPFMIKLNAATIGGFYITDTFTDDFADFYAQDNEPVGSPLDGTLWFNDNRTSLDILVRAAAGWERLSDDQIIYGTEEPVTRADGSPLATGDVWVDTSAVESERPQMSQYNGSEFILHDNTDQTTQQGVIFDDFTDETRADVASGAIVLITDAPNHLLYPPDMLAVNMAQSANTVRVYLESDGVWRNAATNRVDGAGTFGRLAQRRVIANAMQAAVAGNEDLRDPMRNFTLMVAPNFAELTDELVNLNADRGETAFTIIDAPMRKTPTEAVAWIQGVGAAENGEDGLVTKNPYTAAYYPAARATTPAGNTVTVPPSHVALYTYAYNDNVAYQWFAPAGLTRGIVQNASAVGYITGEEEFKAVALNQGQRDAMYTNNMNPIATFPREGVVIWGQKTLNPFSSALDRVNVARLVAYLRERFDVISRPFLFEPNDRATRERITAVFEGFLSDILSKRGVYDFAVLCDESNNTPLRIDRNELWVDVAIEPTKAAEFIYVPIRIVNTGALSS